MLPHHVERDTREPQQDERKQEKKITMLFSSRALYSALSICDKNNTNVLSV